jgi:hypothetical protein
MGKSYKHICHVPKTLLFGPDGKDLIFRCQKHRSKPEWLLKVFETYLELRICALLSLQSFDPPKKILKSPRCLTVGALVL